MGLDTRISIYEAIEKMRGRPLIVYVTSTRPNVNGLMCQDVIPEIIDQMRLLPSGCGKVDILVVSLGGDPMVALRVMTIIRETVREVGVIVPHSAFSAATLLALGADEIVMHPCANLGPVDLQIQVKRGQGSTGEAKQFGVEDLAGFLGYAKDKVGLSDQEHLAAAFKMFCDEVGAIPIGVASRGARLSISLGTKLLEMHMKSDEQRQKAQAIAAALNREFFHHGYPVGRREAREIGLKVVDPPADLCDAIWSAWLDIEAELECRSPFNPVEVLYNAGRADALFAPVQMLNIPPDIPQPMIVQIVNQWNAQNARTICPPADFETIPAIVESPRLASRYVVRGKILARRDWEAKIHVSVVGISSKWEKTEMRARKEQ